MRERMHMALAKNRNVKHWEMYGAVLIMRN